MITDALDRSQNNDREAFDLLYKSMSVASFGRLAKFDYLSMLGKMGIANIRAGSTYMEGATGPLEGARLLFFADKNNHSADTHTIDEWLIKLGDDLGITMQDLEDALCNWQKSPAHYVGFRG